MNDAFLMMFLNATEKLVPLFGLGPKAAPLAARIGVAAVLVACTAWVLRKPFNSAMDHFSAALFVSAALFLLSPTEFPWYYLWVLPFLVLRPMISLLSLSALSHLYHLRFHFAARRCPPLCAEAYRAEKLEEQAVYVHAHKRWFRFAPPNRVYVTRLYKWYGRDVEQVAGSVLDFAARYSPPLKAAIASRVKVEIHWLDYDWSLHAQTEVDYAEPEPAPPALRHPSCTDAQVVKKIADAYLRTRLTPFLRGLFRSWFAWRSAP